MAIHLRKQSGIQTLYLQNEVSCIINIHGGIHLDRLKKTKNAASL
jgi:hypothetical protein